VTTDELSTADAAPSASPDWAISWEAIDRLLALLGVEAACEHGLGPLAAYRWRALGRDLPEQLRREERAAATAHLVAPVLLTRIREAYDGRLVLLKGPEVARRYPGRARRFGDLDLLPDDAEEAQAALLAAGFRLQERDWPPPGYDNVRRPHYHLHPLEWPGLALRVEVHKRVKWPRTLVPPPNEDIFERAIPTSLGIDGLLIPDPSHQAVLLATHAWGEVAMHHVRELTDLAVFVDDDNRAELARVAAAWDFRRGWETTLQISDWLLRGRREPAAVKIWGRYLRDLREPTVLEMHVQEWLSPFWIAPPRRAIRRMAGAIVRDLRPAPDQSWAGKGRQTLRALRSPLAPKSEHARVSHRLQWSDHHRRQHRRDD
jgi:hypothetical protein